MTNIQSTNSGFILKNNDFSNNLIITNTTAHKVDNDLLLNSHSSKFEGKQFGQPRIIDNISLTGGNEYYKDKKTVFKTINH